MTYSPVSLIQYSIISTNLYPLPIQHSLLLFIHYTFTSHFFSLFFTTLLPPSSLLLPFLGVCIKERDSIALRCLPSFLIIGTSSTLVKYHPIHLVLLLLYYYTLLVIKGTFFSFLFLQLIDCVFIIIIITIIVNIGAMKSGTGELMNWLNRHPNLQSGRCCTVLGML